MAAGFTDFEVTWSANIFQAPRRPRTEVEVFGTRGVNFRAQEPE